MENQACRNCLYLKPDHTGRASCHKKAPTNVAYATQSLNQPPKIIVETMWPFMKQDDWCGDWRINRPELLQIPEPKSPTPIA